MGRFLFHDTHSVSQNEADGCRTFFHGRIWHERLISDVRLDVCPNGLSVLVPQLPVSELLLHEGNYEQGPSSAESDLLTAWFLRFGMASRPHAHLILCIAGGRQNPDCTPEHARLRWQT